MAMVSNPYPVARSTGVCAASGRAFKEGDSFIAALVEREGQNGLERLDFAAQEWEAGARPQPPLRMFGFWRGTYQAHEAKKQPLLGDAELLDLFEELGGASEPKQVTFRYILSLLLIRRRVLRVVGTKAGVMSVVPRGSGNTAREPITVADPGLDEQAIADAIEQLGQVVATDAPDPQKAGPAGAGQG
jgi:hypothetical protein